MNFERIGPYAVKKKIGSGGMGTVFLASHVETGQQAAVKILSAALAREEGFVVRFHREIDALKRLKNPHVVELYESGVDQEMYYYAMEYVAGETINERLRREKRIPWEEVIDIAVQICLALKAAHDAGVIHRDLKPSNLILAADGTVKLTDFGIAQLFAASKLTATGGIVGTPEYMSPEQAEGKRATKKSDLYSLGAVMYVMLTGRPPFTGKTSLDVIRKHRFGQFDRPSAIVPETPHWLEEVICQLMEKDPDKRFPNAYVASLRLKEIPKKVQLSKSPETQDVPSHDASATTVYAPAPAVGPKGPGPGTVMHSLMKAEIERGQRTTAFGTLFNNTWFLLACFLLLVVGGAWWFRLRENPTGIADDAPHATKNEAERFFELARHQQRLGDIARAERILEAICTLLADDDEQHILYNRAREQLDQLRSASAGQPDRYAWPRSLLERATADAAEGRTEKAKMICQAIVELYGADPGASKLVEKAQQLLDGDE